MRPVEIYTSWEAPKDYCGTCRVVYEDNHIICIVKPQGLLSQGDDSGDSDAFSLIKSDLAVRNHKPGEAFLGLVHRLDRNTGGTMVFAKTSKGASRLSEELRAKRFGKGYFAVCRGHVSGGGRYMVDSLEKDEKTNTVRKSKNGRPCTLYMRPVCSAGDTTLCFCVPITGRTHQIRAQMAIAGYPLIGDVKYGGPKASIYGGNDKTDMMLWSSVICVKHPTKDVTLAFASVPDSNGIWKMYGEDVYKDFAEDIVKNRTEALLSLKEGGTPNGQI